MLFADRRGAGRALSGVLQEYAGKDTVVLALPRGGVAVAAEVAVALKAPLGLAIVRKIGYPSQEEYAIGAVTESGPPIWNEQERQMVDAEWTDQAVQRARREAKRRRSAYINGRSEPSVANKTVVLVDDGMATGLTMYAAVAELRGRHPARIVVAVPVAPREAIGWLSPRVDEVVVLYAPVLFDAVGNYYRQFGQLSDADVHKALQLAAGV